MNGFENEQWSSQNFGLYYIFDRDKLLVLKITNLHFWLPPPRMSKKANYSERHECACDE